MHASVSEIPLEEGGRNEKEGSTRKVLAFHASGAEGGRQEVGYATLCKSILYLRVYYTSMQHVSFLYRTTQCISDPQLLFATIISKMGMCRSIYHLVRAPDNF